MIQKMILHLIRDNLKHMDHPSVETMIKIRRILSEDKECCIDLAKRTTTESPQTQTASISKAKS